jgi:putative phage-type endonuclease
MTMKRLITTPTNKSNWLELRAKNINSTDVAALFGISPYQTEFELWHRKHSGEQVEIKENERMKWGSRLESAIANGIAEDKGWQVEPFKDYISLPELKIGSSFDFKINPDKLLEIKNVDSLAFKNGWQADDDGNVEAPLHIEMQAQHQMLVSGFKECYIAALVGGNSVKLIHREADEKIHGAILKKVAEFWKSIEKGIAPQPDFERDAEFIKHLYSYAEPNTVIGSNDHIDRLVMAYKEQSDILKRAEEKRDAVKAELLTIVGQAEKVKGEGFTISAGVVSEATVSYTRRAYRTFKVSYKKEKV